MTFHSVVPAPLTILVACARFRPDRWSPSSRMAAASPRPTGHRVSAGTRTAPTGPNATGKTPCCPRCAPPSSADSSPTSRSACLLSGGVDSSLIVGLLAEAGQHGLSTFSIGFESAGGVQGDEFQYSDIVANRFDTDHHQIRIGAERMLPALDGAIGAMSEPMVSHDCVAFYLLGQEVAQPRQGRPVGPGPTRCSPVTTGTRRWVHRRRDPRGFGR